MNIAEKKYDLWLNCATDAKILDELRSFKGNLELIREKFTNDLQFGTGGLRGIIGAGSACMNIYTVAKAAHGMANHILKNFSSPCVAIGYDSRINSELFAKTAARVFATLGIKVYLFNRLVPTPMLSFAVRYLKASGGVMITASHNPSSYNGYKAYGSDGCQITENDANLITNEIAQVPLFEKYGDFDTLFNEGKIEYAPEGAIDAFLRAVSPCVRDIKERNINIVYTPLCGTGLEFVTKALANDGYNDISIVEEQKYPNGNFPTCPYPNPEIPEALALSVKLAKEKNADIVIATDPDADRIGLAVRHNGDYIMTSGNDTGILLLNYICEAKTQSGTMPENPVAIKTIVTTNLTEKIAEKYGVEIIDVLTGFKYIGEQIEILHQNNEEHRCVFAFEESFGYLFGTHVRDKDAVVTSRLVCEMVQYYKNMGKTLIDVLEEIHKEHGYFKSKLENFAFAGLSGFDKMQNIMNNLRENPPKEAFGSKLISYCDYKLSKKIYINGETETLYLPKSNVLKFFFENNMAVAVRPSGTEPKLKMYFFVKGENDTNADEILAKLIAMFSEFTK